MSRPDSQSQENAFTFGRAGAALHGCREGSSVRDMMIGRKNGHYTFWVFRFDTLSRPGNRHRCIPTRRFDQYAPKGKSGLVPNRLRVLLPANDPDIPFACELLRTGNSRSEQ
jgi:hypothetical protein